MEPAVAFARQQKNDPPGSNIPPAKSSVFALRAPRRLDHLSGDVLSSVSTAAFLLHAGLSVPLAQRAMSGIQAKSGRWPEEPPCHLVGRGGAAAARRPPHRTSRSCADTPTTRKTTQAPPRRHLIGCSSDQDSQTDTGRRQSDHTS